jgi:hypothetical protein
MVEIANSFQAPFLYSPFIKSISHAAVSEHRTFRKQLLQDFPSIFLSLQNNNIRLSLVTSDSEIQSSTLLPLSNSASASSSPSLPPTTSSPATPSSLSSEFAVSSSLLTILNSINPKNKEARMRAIREEIWALKYKQDAKDFDFVYDDISGKMKKVKKKVKKRNKKNRLKNPSGSEEELVEQYETQKEEEIVILPPSHKTLSIAELSKLMKVSSNDIIKELLVKDGLMISLNQTLTKAQIIKILQTWKKQWQESDYIPPLEEEEEEEKE